MKTQSINLLLTLIIKNINKTVLTSITVLACTIIVGCMKPDNDCPSAVLINNRTGHLCAFYADEVFIDSIKAIDNYRVHLPYKNYDHTFNFKMIQVEGYDSIPKIYTTTQKFIPCSLETWTVSKKKSYN